MQPTQSIKLAILALCSLSAQADEVILKNGDRISGTVLNKSGKMLEIKTDYAAKVVIKWDAIQTLKTDKPLSITLTDKQELTGVASAAADGSLTLNSNGVYQTQPIPLANIKEINKKFGLSSIIPKINIGKNVVHNFQRG